MFGSLSQNQRRPVRSRGLFVEMLEERANPVVIADNDQYSVAAAQVLTVEAKNGVLSNDFSTDNPQAILQAVQQSPVTYVGASQSPSGQFPAVPVGLLTFNANGGFTFRAPSTLPAGATGVTFKYLAVDLNSTQTSQQATVTINITNATTLQKLFAVGSGPGQPAQVRVFNASNGLELYSFFPYEPSFTGGVRVATGDVTADGVDDIVVVPDNGGSIRLQVYDGKDGVKIADFIAVDPTFRGGGYVAVGDSLGGASADGKLYNDIIVGAGNGGGPRITVYDGFLIGSGTVGSSPLLDFFAFEDTQRGGVQVAAGNIEGFSQTDSNRRDYIVAGAGPGGGPAVRVFDGRDVAIRTQPTVPGGTINPIPTAFPPATKGAFFAFDPNSRVGVNVAVGSFRSDGKADIIAGQAAGQALVRVIDGRSFAQLREFTSPATDNPTSLAAPANNSTPNAQFAGTVNFNTNSGVGNNGLVVPLVGQGVGGAGSAGARVAAIDRNGDNVSDILVGAGNGLAARVRIFDGNALFEISNLLAFPTTFLGGVYVGGNAAR